MNTDPKHCFVPDPGLPGLQLVLLPLLLPQSLLLLLVLVVLLLLVLFLLLLLKKSNYNQS